MGVYSLQAKQKLPISMQEAWEFLSNPQNLEKITPKELGFKIISKLPEKMYEGMIISYKVSPLFAIPMTWVTEITHYNFPFYFVDEQRIGPYKMWHHEHFIEEIEGGVLMTDIITYSPPFGILGNIVHPIIIRPNLDKIFAFRKKVLEEKFGKMN